MDYDFNNKTTLGKIKLLMLKGEQGKTGHGAYAAYDVAEMTDKQQIYVYTGPTDSTYTRGDWYYWDEEDKAWASGGAYNSYALTTDPTLSIEGDAADAKAVGDELSGINSEIAPVLDRSWLTRDISGGDLNTIKENGYYQWLASNIPSHTPSNIDGAGLCVHFQAATYSQTAWIAYQICFDYNHETSYFRVRRSSSAAWGDWLEIATGDDVSNINSEIAPVLDRSWLTRDISGGNLNDIKENGYYQWLASNIPSNTPSNIDGAGLCVHFQAATYSETAWIAYQICFDYNHETSYYRIRRSSSAAWGDWYRLCRDADLVRHVGYIRYAAGSYQGGDASEQLRIFIPVTVGYIVYELRHYNPSGNEKCDVWRIFGLDWMAAAADGRPAQGSATALTTAAEWELAFKLTGRPDFAGGYIHGNEVMTDFQVMIDGVNVDYTTLTNNYYPFDDLRIRETSVLYDPNDNDRSISESTQIVKHGREYVINADEGHALQINQSARWLVDAPLDNCFMAMFPPSKSYTNRAYANNDFELLTLESSSFSITKEKATSVVMSKSSGGLFAAVSVPVYPKGMTGGDLALITDNQGNNYNKLYFKICNGASAATGDLWQSRTVYRLDYNAAG